MSNSISQRYIDKILNGDPSVTEMLAELGIDPFDPTLCKASRMDVYRHNPNSFLSKSTNGMPTFPTRGSIGQVSKRMLKRGITAAKAKFTQTGDSKYEEIASKLQKELDQVKSKTHPMPEIYKYDPMLLNILGSSDDD